MDWQNKEVWLRNLPKEEIKMIMSIGNKVMPESNMSFEAVPQKMGWCKKWNILQAY